MMIEKGIEARSRTERDVRAPASATIQPRTTVRGWLSVISIAGGTFALVTAQFLPIGLMTQIASDLEATTQQASLLVTVPGLISAIAAPGIVVLSGKHDRRIVLWGLTGLLALSCLIISIGHSLQIVISGGFLLGIGAGGFWAVGTSLAGRLVAPPSSGRAMTIVFGGVSAGIVVGVPCGTFLGDQFGWRVAFVMTAAIAFAVLVGQIALVPRLKPKTALGPRDLGAVFQTSNTRKALSAVILLVAGQFCAYTYIVPSLERFANAKPATISALLFLFGASGFIGNFIGGAAVQRNVRRGLSQITCVIGLVLILFPFLVVNESSATVLIAVWGFAYGAIPVGLQTWVLRTAPEMSESAGAVFIGVFQSAVAIGGVLGSVFIYLYDLSVTLFLGGVLVLTTTLIIRSRQKSADRP